MKRLKYFAILIILSFSILASCDLPGLGGGNNQKNIKISALATSESQIMAYMLKEQIEHDSNGEVQLQSNITQ